MADEEIITKGLSISSDGEDENTGAGNNGPARGNYLICIGIGKYEMKELNTLGDTCKYDCEDLRSVLESDFDFEPVKGVYDWRGNKINDDEQHLIDEKATKGNIENLFANLAYHPDFRNKPGLPAHNLVIYYSGHGETVGTDNLDLFYFVPHEYDGPLGPSDPNKLYSVYFGLIPKIKNIRFHSLVLIIDACRSAATFNLTDWFKTPLSTNTGNERCAWALCSSAKNEDSFLIRGERNSFFTKNLLAKLKHPEKIDIKLELLGADLKSELRSLDQTVFSNRLLLIPDNAGDFNFCGNDDRRKKLFSYTRKERLKKDIYRINYSDQRTSIQQWYNFLKTSTSTNPYLLFLSTAPQYGLKLARRQICVSNSFPVKNFVIYQDEPIKLHTIKELKADKFLVLDIISGFLDKKANDCGYSMQMAALALEKDEKTRFEKIKEALIERLLKMLDKNPVILEFVIDHETIVPEIKDEFFTILHSVLNALELKVKVKHPFCVLVLDADGSDYKKMEAKFTGNTIQYYIMPPVLDVDHQVIDDWYNEVVRDMDHIELQRYDELFLEIIDAMRVEYLGNGSCPPGKFIEALCEKSGCRELAFEILNF